MADGYVGADQPMLLTNEVPVCLDRPGRVEIVEVALKEVEGPLRVDAFAVWPFGPEYPDLEPGETTLWRVGFTEENVWVESVCPGPEERAGDVDALAGKWMHLGIRLSKPSATTARGSTLMIYYMPETASRRYLREIPFGVVLCEGKVRDEATGHRRAECDYLEDDYYRR